MTAKSPFDTPVPAIVKEGVARACCRQADQPPPIPTEMPQIIVFRCFAALERFQWMVVELGRHPPCSIVIPERVAATLQHEHRPFVYRFKDMAEDGCRQSHAGRSPVGGRGARHNFPWRKLGEASVLTSWDGNHAFRGGAPGQTSLSLPYARTKFVICMVACDNPHHCVFNVS